MAACHEPEPVQALDAPNPCVDAHGAAVFVDSTVAGPLTGRSATVPITPTTGGEMLVVAVAGANADTRYVRMLGGQSVFQVGTGSETCGKRAAVFSVGNIEPGVASFTIESDHALPADAFVVFVMTFDGLDPGTGAKLSDNFGFGEYSAAACPGSVVISMATSCGEVGLLPESPFQVPGSLDGMAAAYYIPSAYGEYRADWRAADAISTAMVQFE